MHRISKPQGRLVIQRYCRHIDKGVFVNTEIIETTTTTTVAPSTTTTTTTTLLTASLKTMIEGLVSAFIIKVEAKYTSIASRITFLDALITKLGTLTIGKNGALFSYLKDKLQEQSDILRLQSLLDI